MHTKYTAWLMLIFGLNITQAVAQSATDTVAHQVDFGVSLGRSTVILHAGYLQTHRLRQGKFRLGYGLRFHSFRSSDDYDYTTTPALVRTGKSGLSSWFAASVPARIDTFITENPIIQALNAGLYVGYRINPQLEIGIYTDMIGISLGPQQEGVYRSPMQEQVPQTVAANPQTFNFLVASRGTYQAELRAIYWLSARLGLNIGVNIFRSAYRTEQGMNFSNRRFSHAGTFFSTAISYRW